MMFFFALLEKLAVMFFFALLEKLAVMFFFALLEKLSVRNSCASLGVVRTRLLDFLFASLTKNLARSMSLREFIFVINF
jgi:hypothetical protein